MTHKHTSPLYYFPKRKKEKKESRPSSGRMQRSKGGEERAVYIPLLLCQPGTYICFSFYFFWANNLRHSLGWWSGFWWIDTSAKVCKTFATAFRAANSSLKNFGRWVSSWDFLMYCLSALAWDGERQQCGYFA